MIFVMLARTAAGVRVFFVDYGAGGGFHEKSGRGLDEGVVGGWSIG